MWVTLVISIGLYYGQVWADDSTGTVVSSVTQDANFSTAGSEVRVYSGSTTGGSNQGSRCKQIIANVRVLILTLYVKVQEQQQSVPLTL
ncbi:hypothetical protein A1QO_04000 [Vibrio genomosp. F10 str. ZF-129]|uniref:Uncharacterized protein n=1 Tax=Vibrio genomosp. F10 str. ZF-129 TaxID=1187848 RepID=A0A1E5BIL5_9VIBR|nr:hypothetical protein A1QO_04000 [Vibrio genomosp. F10 str. ZF-129]